MYKSAIRYFIYIFSVIMLKELHIIPVYPRVFQAMSNELSLPGVLGKVSVRMEDGKSQIPLCLYLLHVSLNLNPFSENNILTVKYVKTRTADKTGNLEFLNLPEEIIQNSCGDKSKETMFLKAYRHIINASQKQVVIPNQKTKEKVRSESMQCMSRFSHDLKKDYTSSHGLSEEDTMQREWILDLYNTLWSHATERRGGVEWQKRTDDGNIMLEHITLMLLLCHLAYCARNNSVIKKPIPKFPVRQVSTDDHDQYYNENIDAAMLVAHTIYWISKVNNPNNDIDMKTVADTNSSNLVCKIYKDTIGNRTARLYKSFNSTEEGTNQTNEKKLPTQELIGYPAIWVLAYAHLQYINIVDITSAIVIDSRQITTSLDDLINQFKIHDENSNGSLSMSLVDVTKYVEKFRKSSLDDHVQYELYGAKYAYSGDKNDKSVWFRINQTAYMLYLAGYSGCEMKKGNYYMFRSFMGGGSQNHRAYRDKVEKLANRHYDAWSHTKDPYIIPLRRANLMIHPSRGRITVRHRSHSRPVVLAFEDDGRQVTIH